MNSSDFMIAVTQNRYGNLTTLTQTEKLCFYKWNKDKIILTEETLFKFESEADLPSARERLLERLIVMTKLLDQVNVLISKEFPDLATSVLERLNLKTLTLKSFDETDLTYIKDFSLGLIPPSTINNCLIFESLDYYGDRYFLDLAQALKFFPNESSKTILRKFLKSNKFTSLKIVCDHLPPWLLDELKKRRFDWGLKDLPTGEVFVIVTPSSLNECPSSPKSTSTGIGPR
jgi:uncharacterized protein (DUF2249 family)